MKWKADGVEVVEEIDVMERKPGGARRGRPHFVDSSRVRPQPPLARRTSARQQEALR